MLIFSSSSLYELVRRELLAEDAAVLRLVVELLLSADVEIALAMRFGRSFEILGAAEYDRMSLLAELREGVVGG